MNDEVAGKKADLNQWQVWLLAARPKTLPAAASPVILGSSVAFADGGFSIFPALAALLAALLLQIGANLANDVFDYYKGTDAGERLGPVRVTQSGLLDPEEVVWGMGITFGMAILLGIYLTAVAGWPVVLIGLASVLAAVAYTGGPFPFGYYGLGDLFVFLFFGPVAVCGTYFVQVGEFSRLALWSSLPMGFLITAILVVNNLRDIVTDRAVGKITLAVRLGDQGARLEYLLCLVASYMVPLWLWLGGLTIPWVNLAWLSLPLAISMVGMIWRYEGRALNNTLAGTGRLTLVFAVLFSLGLVLPALFPNI